MEMVRRDLLDCITFFETLARFLEYNKYIFFISLY